MIFRRFWGIAVLLIFWTAFLPQTAFACSGGSALTIKGLIHNSDYAVRAYPVEIDELGQNAILRVEQYLVGGAGPQYLLLNRNDPTLVNYIQAGRSSGGDCLGLFEPLRHDEPLYLFLTRNTDGSYEMFGGSYNPLFYQFPTPDSTVIIYTQGVVDENGAVNDEQGDRQSETEVTESQFLALIAQASGETPSAPDLTTPYPLKAPLEFTTNGSPDRYMLPVDWHDPIELTDDMLSLHNHPLWSFGFSDAGSCTSVDCIQLSPNNLDIAVQRDENTIRFTWGHVVNGQALLFSTTSDAVAVWNECILTIYTTGYPRLGEEYYSLDELNHETLHGNEDCHPFQKQASWSPDGRLLAYSDTDGIWLWDVFSSSSPRLIIPSSGGVIPHPIDFSPLGRYLAISEGNTYRTFDLITGIYFPDGVISPDDRILIHYETTADAPAWEICVLAPYQCTPQADSMYYMRVDEDGDLVVDHITTQIRYAHWIDNSDFLILACVDDEPHLCSLYQWQPAYLTWWGFYLAQGSAFNYDEQDNMSAVVSSERTLWIDGHTVNLNASTDGDLIDVKWMPSLFNYR